MRFLTRTILNDPIAAGTIIGLLANLPKVAANFLLYNLKVSKYHCWHMIVQVFLPSDWPFNVHTLVIGGILDSIVSAAFGVGLLCFLRWTDWKHPVFKGILYTFATWLFVCLTLGGKKLENPFEVYHSLADHLIWGAFATYFISCVCKEGNRS
jgi:hypothetical protein